MTGRDGRRRLAQALELFFGRREPGAPAARSVPASAEPGTQELLDALFAAPPPAADVPESKTLGDFRLLREIGRGGMGIVYEAVQLSLDRRVAVKVLPPSTHFQPEQVARLRREAMLVAQLDHPGIVKVLAVGAEGDTSYLAMELVEGQPMQPGLLPLRDSVELVAQVAEALGHAHRAGVIHRDVKPGNILVRQDGRAVLTDFGLARADAMPSLTQTGAFTGTPYYASPEQAAGKAALDARTDVFSLGAMLYEVSTRRLPFPGETTQAVLRTLLAQEPIDPLRIAPELPPDLVAITLKALEKDPERRYPHGAAFAADLRAFLAHRPVSARRPGPATLIRRFVRREPFKAASIALAVTALPALAGLSGYVLARRPEIRAGANLLRAERIEHLLAEGFFEVQEGDVRAGEQRLQEVLQLDPASREARLGLELAQARLAGRPFQIVGAQAPDPGADASALDLCLAGLRELQDCKHADAKTHARALELLAGAVARAPQARFLYHTQWAHAAGHAGDPQAARAAAYAMQDLWPDARLTWRWSAFALGRVDPKAALPAAQRWNRIAPEDVESWMGLALIQADSGQLAEAVATAREASGRWPGSAALVKVQGEFLDRSGALEEALVHLRKALAMVSTRPESGLDPGLLHEYIGFVLNKLGRTKEAIPAFERALEAGGRQAVWVLRLAIALADEGRHAEARPYYEQAMALAPDLRDALLKYLDLVYWRLHDKHAYRDAALQWIERHPDDGFVLAAAALGLLETASDDAGADRQRALELALHAVRVDPHPPAWMWRILARSWIAQGNPGAGLQAIGRARALTSDAAEVAELDRYEAECRAHPSAPGRVPADAAPGVSRR